MSISGETIGQQTAKTYEEALNGNAVTALQIGTGKGKLPVSQLAPACIETTDVTRLSFSDIKFARDTGRTIVCETIWGHAAFHVHNDRHVNGHPDVYRLTADVGGNTLMYTMTTSDEGDTCTWSTLKVIPTSGEVVWDLVDSEHGPSFAEVRDAMLNGVNAYIRQMGAVVGYYDWNQKTTPTSECTGRLTLFVSEFGGDGFGLPYINVIELYPTLSVNHVTKFHLDETHLIKYPSDKYSQLHGLADSFYAGSYTTSTGTCRSCFIADLYGVVGTVPVQPVSSMRQLESGDTIFGRTLGQRAILVSSLDPVAEVINHYLFYYDETVEKFSRKLTATDV